MHGCHKIKITFSYENNKIIDNLDYKPKLLLQSCCAPCSTTVIERLKEYENIIYVGNGAIKYKELLEENFGSIVISDNNLQSASCVGKIGYKKHKEKDLASADTIMPMYLRKSQAERMKKEKGA